MHDEYMPANSNPTQQGPGTEPSPSSVPAAEPEVEATPAAIAHAEETGVDLTQLEGSGADGRIVKADVEAAAQTSPEGEAQQG